MMNKRFVRIYTAITLALGIAQIAVFFFFFFITAAAPEQNFHSLLSSEGIRWFFGSFIHNLTSPILVWLILCILAYGALTSSRILQYDSHVYRQRLGMNLVIVEFGVCLLVLLMLTMFPHAILLSVTGNLFPSSFSGSIIPIATFMIILFSESFAVMSGRFNSPTKVVESLLVGIHQLASLFLIYILAMELFHSVLFIIYG